MENLSQGSGRSYFLVQDYLFTSQFHIWIFCYAFTYFVPCGVIQNRVTKVNFKYFNENFAKAWLFEKFIFELDASSYSFKITFILSRQVISLKKMVVLSAKFADLISWSPICYPLIFLLALMKLTSTSAAIMHKSIENQVPLAKFSHKGERIRQEAIYFNFRLDFGVYIFNHVNEFISISARM